MLLLTPRHQLINWSSNMQHCKKTSALLLKENGGQLMGSGPQWLTMCSTMDWVWGRLGGESDPSWATIHLSSVHSGMRTGKLLSTLYFCSLCIYTVVCCSSTYQEACVIEWLLASVTVISSYWKRSIIFTFLEPFISYFWIYSVFKNIAFWEKNKNEK